MESAPVILPRSLVFTHDGMPGYTRQRRGRGFSYLTPARTTLTDVGERRRITSLVIPPAYETVWISLKPNGHLQATGIDQRGRKQYRYHPEWQVLSSDRKFQLLRAFALALPRLRRRVKSALARPEPDRERILGGIVALLDATGFRIGNRRYVRQNRSFGLASLLSRHLSEDSGRWIMRFRGKAGKDHEAEIADRRLVSLIAELHELPGQALFQYEDPVGDLHEVGSTDVNDWLKDAGGGDFTAKQFRTWRATVMCARELGSAPPAESEAACRRAERDAIRVTAEALHHTVATCRKYYVHPAILRAYRSGELFRVMNSAPPRLRRGDESGKLRVDERRTLKVIEGSTRLRSGRGTEAAKKRSNLNLKKP